ncbi:uncharacterized protein LOC111691377 [Anoplophora glabripennis]|uniref:uncharacterized protein LOC111691377 n=1 Tax=Anoplophora glabripennis TaxID=217634 RepID=UPI000C77EDB3|nr:uncharacterized protein LOC111691377 [Anoplophora glabripennis]
MKTLYVFFIVAVAAAYGGLIGAPIATSIVASRQLALGPTAVAAPIALSTPLLTRSVIAGPAIAGPAIAPIGLGGIGWGGSLLGKGLCC